MRRPPEREVLLDVLADGDPASGDEALFEPGSYLNYQRYGGAELDAPAYLAAEVAFHGRALAVLQGDAPWADPELIRLAAILKIDHPPHHDVRPPRIAEVLVPDEVFSDIVEDLVPDYAVLTERITGDDRPATVPVVGALAFVPMTADSRRPIDWWCEEEDDRALVRAARVVDASPPGLFRDGVPLLPYPERFVPTGLDQNPAPAGVYVGRPYLIASGWAWSTCVRLPRVPTLAAVSRRLGLELWQHRRTERRASVEDCLRARPEVFYRACFEASG
ncbi:MAG: hypothetical protein Q8P18_09655 [Pseudomonadota bacterium]|nr:hypothetical protein [Pseudomonadota bacterium]